jgi:hypothetical protein
MAAYLQWLAPKMDRYKQDLTRAVIAYRDDALQHGFASSHPRAPEIYANMVAGTEVFLDFMTEAGALTVEQNTALLEELKEQLKQVFSEQAIYQAEQDECERFLNLLRALFSSGNAHISDRLKQAPPATRPHSWGWRCSEVKGINASHEDVSIPMGDCIGYYDEKLREVWLIQDSAFAEVQKLARNQGDAFLVSPCTLWRRMGDAGLITKFDMRPNGSKQWTVLRTVAGVRKRLMILSADTVESGG